MYPIRCFTCKKLLGNIWDIWFILTEKKCISDAYIVDGKSKKIPKSLTIQKCLESYGLEDKVSPPVACDLLNINRRCCRSILMSSIEYE